MSTKAGVKYSEKSLAHKCIWKVEKGWILNYMYVLE